MYGQTAMPPRGAASSQSRFSAPLPSPSTGASAASGRRNTGGGCFLLAVFILIFFIYMVYVTVLLFPLVASNFGLFSVGLCVAFHCAFACLLIAFCKAAATDPGQVPANWGFYMGDDNKRRRYCKVCNVWKPDRTHHCSVCGRCVLNMDHHCPWINNCVGFFNRKFFLQLLFYALCTVSVVFLHSLHYVFVGSLSEVPEHFAPPPPPSRDASTVAQPSVWRVAEYVGVCAILLLSLLLICALVPFTRFHINLMIRNSTTIENMEPTNPERGRYDLGIPRNIEQVMGPNPCCWLAPCHSAGNRPVGDGVRWPQPYSALSEMQRVV